jgi:hypothetical protein
LIWESNELSHWPPQHTTSKILAGDKFFENEK